MIGLLGIVGILGALLFGAMWFTSPQGNAETSLYGLLSVACMVVYGICQALL